MSKPEEIKIQPKNINAAAGEIIAILEDTSKGNVTFVGGWHGFGASAALKGVAQRLKSSKSKFDTVVHVDCSLWKSMRALQKAIAEELELPLSVMAIFDWCDEEDDFSGLDECSRGVIADIRTEIFRRLVNSKFVVIFHNGSNKYIDLYESCGVPVIPVLGNKVLWTWHGRFRSKFKDFPEQEKMELHTDVVVNYSRDDCIRDEALLEEAKEIVAYMGVPEPYMNHMIVEKCFQYAYALGSVHWFNWLNMDSDKHVFNYLVCDGIIKGQGNTSTWEVADAIQRNMCMDWLPDLMNDYIHHVRRHLQCRLPDRFVLVEHKTGLLPDETGMVLAEATSCFIILDANTQVHMMTLPDGIFQHSHSSKLRVLCLSYCSFSFESPPFHCCSQLRFLQLVACMNIPSDKHACHNEDMSCFQKLWVLHLRCTNWYRLLSQEMMNFMADLRELHVHGLKYWSIGSLRGRRPSLVKVHVKVDPRAINEQLMINNASIPNLSSSSFLKTIILDCCVELEQVVSGFLPPSLDSFIFRGCSGSRISSISLLCCSQLKSIVLEGHLARLEELDLSGTVVKTLDLGKMSTPKLKRLILLGCKKLCAIVFPASQRTNVLEVLHINTIRSTSPGQADWEEKPKDAIAAMDHHLFLLLLLLNWASVDMPPLTLNGTSPLGIPGSLGHLNR